MKLINFLRSKGAIQISGITGSKLCEFASEGNLENLKKMFENGEDVNIGDYDCRTALHLAACENHLEIIKFLIEDCMCDINIRDRWGNTALDEAKRYNNKEIEEYLGTFSSSF